MKNIYLTIVLIVAGNSWFLPYAHADQYANLAGSYRLVSDQLDNLDGTPFSCGKKPDGSTFACQAVKGKIVIEALPDKSYLYLEAYTVKGIATMGNMGNYKIKQGNIIESNYTASGLQCCNASFKYLKLENDTLTRHIEPSNSRQTTVWKRVGSDETRDKYLERELDRQRTYFNELSKK